MDGFFYFHGYSFERFIAGFNLPDYEIILSVTITITAAKVLIVKI